MSDAVCNHANTHCYDCRASLVKTAARIATLEARIAELERERDGVRRLAADVGKQGEALIRSLGEYVRQSMHANPEWRPGVESLEQAVRALRAEVPRPTPMIAEDRDALEAARADLDEAVRLLREMSTNGGSAFPTCPKCDNFLPECDDAANGPLGAYACKGREARAYLARHPTPDKEPRR